MRFVADAYYRGLRAAGVPARRRRLNDAGLILCYHNVVRAEQDRVGCPGLHESRARFERQMRWLADHYCVIGLSEFIERLTQGSSLRSTVALTFDDGYAGVFEHAVPILAALRLPATVFIVAEAVGRAAPFSWDERAGHPTADWATIGAALGRGIELGAHSCNHPSLPALTDAQLKHELVASRAAIHRATGIWPGCFAYPFGHWDGRVRDAVRSAGYGAGLTLDFGLNGRDADPWALRRINVPSGISDAAFEAWTAGCYRRAH